ncbi:MAG: YfhO family protein, partial [Pseudorhodoplanes sp.]
LAGRARLRPAAAIVLAAIATGELLRWNVASHLNSESAKIYAVLDRPSEEDAKALDLLDREIQERQRNGEYPRVEIMGVGGPWQNLAMVRGWESTNGYNPLRIGYYDRLVAPGEATFAPALRRFPASFETYDCALARALGLEYVVFDRPIEQVPRLSKIPVAEILLAGPKLWIYRLKNTLPRVAFTSRIQVADADALGLSGQLLFNPSLDRVLIDDDTPPAEGYDVSVTPATRGRAAIASIQPGRIEIDARSEMGGMLALHAIYYPGWVAEIDGKPAPVLRADVLFRGVEVPPGDHRIVFRYAPFSLENLSNALRVALHRVQ